MRDGERERQNERKREADTERKGSERRETRGCNGGVGGAVGRQSVEVTALWSRRDVAGVGGEEHRWRRTAVSRPRGK